MTAGDNFVDPLYPSTHGPNIIVLTNAGKPVFCRYGNLESIAHITATVQVIIDNIRSEDELIHSVQTDCSIIVFMNVRSLTLIAVQYITDKYQQFYDLPWLKLLLEITYQHFILLLSDRFQMALEESPSLDLQFILESCHKSLQNILYKASPLVNCASLQLACGVEVYEVSSPKVWAFI